MGKIFDALEKTGKKVTEPTILQSESQSLKPDYDQDFQEKLKNTAILPMHTSNNI